MAQKNIGLVAGRGHLPFEVLEEIKRRGARSLVGGLRGEVDTGVPGMADEYQELSVCRLGDIIGYFKSFEIAEVVFAGKVCKEALFQNDFDPVFLAVLKNLPEKNDDAILLAVVKEFEKNGLLVAKQTDYLQRLLAQPGPVIGEVTEREMDDVRLGFRVAKAIGGMDIGQSVVVKQGVVLAVEAIEGTDQAIIRGGKLGGAGAVVVKVSKPFQDERFDVPTVGKSTIDSMISIQAAVLGVEAQKTLITEKKEFLELAASHKIKIIAV